MFQIRIVKFWTKYQAGREPVDMVEYCAPGMAQRSTTVARVKDLARIRQVRDSDDTAGNMAFERWQVISKAYEAWKQGQDVPVSGTPLAAWPGLTPEQAEVFRLFGLKTVEEIANASSSIIARVQLPGVVEIQANAKRFLDASDQGKFAAQMAEKDTQISTLTDQLEELRQMFLQMSRPADDDDLEADGSERPKRGRPRKVLAEAIAE